jgi:RimJ/RimL family protein N-acetyltransferase
MPGELQALAGAGFMLRGLQVDDAPSLASHADDEEVWRNLFEGFPRPYTMADAHRWCSEGCRDPQNGWVWGIDVDGAVVGCIGMVPQLGWLGCNAEVGYWVGRAFWRRGIASGALKLVSDWAWRERTELTRLIAPIFSWNLASQRVAQKCGYVLEAQLPRSAIKAGRIIDRVQYASYRTPPR